MDTVLVMQAYCLFQAGNLCLALTVFLVCRIVAVVTEQKAADTIVAAMSDDEDEDPGFIEGDEWKGR